MFGDVPKWLKGPHSKCGRSGVPRRESSNLSISARLSLDASRVPDSVFYYLSARVQVGIYFVHSHRLNPDTRRVLSSAFSSCSLPTFKADIKNIQESLHIGYVGCFYFCYFFYSILQCYDIWLKQNTICNFNQSLSFMNWSVIK